MALIRTDAPSEATIYRLMRPVAIELVQSLSYALGILANSEEWRDSGECFGEPAMLRRVTAVGEDRESMLDGEMRWREECLLECVRFGWLQRSLVRRVRDGVTMSVPAYLHAGEESPELLHLASLSVLQAPESAVLLVARAGRGSGMQLLRWSKTHVELTMATNDAREAGATEEDLGGLPDAIRMPTNSSRHVSSIVMSGAFPRAAAMLATIQSKPPVEPEVDMTVPVELPEGFAVGELLPAIKALLSAVDALPASSLWPDAGASSVLRQWRKSALQSLVDLGWISRSGNLFSAANPDALWDLARGIPAHAQSLLTSSPKRAAPRLSWIRSQTPAEVRPALKPQPPPPIVAPTSPSPSLRDISLMEALNHIVKHPPTTCTHIFRRIPGSDQLPWRDECVEQLVKCGFITARDFRGNPLSWKVFPKKKSRPAIEAALQALRSGSAQIQGPSDVHGFLSSFSHLIPVQEPGVEEAAVEIAAAPEIPVAEPVNELEGISATSELPTPEVLREALVTAARFLLDRDKFWKKSGVKIPGDTLDQVLPPQILGKFPGSIPLRRGMVNALVNAGAARHSDGRLWSVINAQNLSLCVDALVAPGPSPDRLRGWAPRALWLDLIEIDAPGINPERDQSIEREMLLRLRAQPFTKWTVAEAFGGSVDVPATRSQWRREKLQYLVSRGILTTVGDKSSVWHLTDVAALSRLINGDELPPVPAPEPQSVELPPVEDIPTPTASEPVPYSAPVENTPPEPGTIASYEHAVLALHSSEAFQSREEIFVRAPLAASYDGARQLSFLKVLASSGLLESRGSTRWVRWRPVAERRDELLDVYENFLPPELRRAPDPDPEEELEVPEVPISQPEPSHGESPGLVAILQKEVVGLQENLSALHENYEIILKVVFDQARRLEVLESKLGIEDPNGVKESE